MLCNTLCRLNPHYFYVLNQQDISVLSAEDGETIQTTIYNVQPCPHWYSNTEIHADNHFHILTQNQHLEDVAFAQALATTLPVTANPTRINTSILANTSMAETITLTPNQPAAIVQNTVATMAAAPAYIAPAPVIVSSHKKPGKYKGEKECNLDCFITQCKTYWVVANIADKKTKVLTALGRLEDKALQWAIELINYMATNAGALPPICDTWPHFRNLLKWYFGDATPEDRAIIEMLKPAARTMWNITLLN